MYCATDWDPSGVIVRRPMKILQPLICSPSPSHTIRAKREIIKMDLKINSIVSLPLLNSSYRFAFLLFRAGLRPASTALVVAIFHSFLASRVVFNVIASWSFAWLISQLDDFWLTATVRKQLKCDDGWFLIEAWYYRTNSYDYRSDYNSLAPEMWRKNATRWRANKRVEFSSRFVSAHALLDRSWTMGRRRRRARSLHRE